MQLQTLKAYSHYDCALRCMARDRDADSVSISLATQRHATQCAAVMETAVNDAFLCILILAVLSRFSCVMLIKPHTRDNTCFQYKNTKFADNAISAS